MVIFPGYRLGEYRPCQLHTPATAITGAADDDKDDYPSNIKPDEIGHSKKLMHDFPAPGSEGDSDKRNFQDSKKARDDSHAYINIYPYREGKGGSP